MSENNFDPRGNTSREASSKGNSDRLPRNGCLVVEELCLTDEESHFSCGEHELWEEPNWEKRERERWTTCELQREIRHIERRHDDSATYT